MFSWYFCNVNVLISTSSDSKSCSTFTSGILSCLPSSWGTVRFINQGLLFIFFWGGRWVNMCIERKHLLKQGNQGNKVRSIYMIWLEGEHCSVASPVVQVTPLCWAVCSHSAAWWLCWAGRWTYGRAQQNLVWVGLGLREAALYSFISV